MRETHASAPKTQHNTHASTTEIQKKPHQPTATATTTKKLHRLCFVCMSGSFNLMEFDSSRLARVSVYVGTRLCVLRARIENVQRVARSAISTRPNHIYDCGAGNDDADDLRGLLSSCVCVLARHQHRSRFYAGQTHAIFLHFLPAHMRWAPRVRPARKTRARGYREINSAQKVLKFCLFSICVYFCFWVLACTLPRGGARLSHGWFCVCMPHACTRTACRQVAYYFRQRVAARIGVSGVG